MLKCDSEPRQPVDLAVDIVAFKIDCGGRRDHFFGIDLDRQGRAAAGLKPGISIFRAVDDLANTERPVEGD